VPERISEDQLTRWLEHVDYADADESRAMAAELVQLRRLIADFTDRDDCRIDHHGGCQAHGYLSLEPGELCPHTEAKQLLAEWEEADRG